MLLTDKSFNTAIGTNALTQVARDGNTAVGRQALQLCRDGGNTAVGIDSLSRLSFGRNNTAIGGSTGINISNGQSNILVGITAGNALISQRNNITIGENSMSVGAGDEGIAIGTNANGNSGNYNIGIGSDAMTPLGGNFDECIAIGHNALSDGGVRDIAIGTNALSMPTAGNNIAIGSDTIRATLALPPAENNIAIGEGALNNAGAVLGSRNVAIGNQARHGVLTDDSIGLGTQVVLQRNTEFRLSDFIIYLNVGTGFSGQTFIGNNVFPDNTTAIAGGFAPGDVYVVDPVVLGQPPIGGAPAGPAILAVVY